MKQNSNLFIRIRDFLTSNEQILFVTFPTPVSTYCSGITADNNFINLPPFSIRLPWIQYFTFILISFLPIKSAESDKVEQNAS